MIKESCNLIGQEHDLVNLKTYAIYDKKTLFSTKIQFLITSYVVISLPDQPDSKLSTTEHGWLYPTSISSLTCNFP